MNKFYITGCSKGLGKALVDVLIRSEHNSITGISRSNELEHPRFKHFSIDLSQPDDLLILTERIFEKPGNFERMVLINNAGYLGSIKYMGKNNDDEFINIFNINLIAPSILTNAFMRKYTNSKCEKIILNISSGASKTPYDGWAGYCSSKAGLDMLSRVASMESERMKNGFKIFALAPGVIDTDMQRQVRNASERDFSRLSHFLSLKDDNKLLSPEKAATQIIRFIHDKSLQNEVIQDIRDLL